MPDQHCVSSDIGEPLLTNVNILNGEKTKRHVDHMATAALALLPPSGGKPTFDVLLNKPVAYEMLRHFLGTHCQCQICALDSYGDLLLSEFLQGYVSMILRSGIGNLTAEAMVKCLGMLGEALIGYQWHDIRDWMNAILHEVGQGRVSWRDHKFFADQLNATKLRASIRQAEDPSIPVCTHYSQGRCNFA